MPHPATPGANIRGQLILVRHARPRIEPDVPPPLWRLSAEGRAAAEALAARIADLAPAAVVASTEAKAVETAQALAAPLGLTVASDGAFDEHRREAWPFETDPGRFAARVRRAFAEPHASVDGAELMTHALARFAAGLAARPARPLVVVTHGTALSAYLAGRTGGDPLDLWQGLRMPDLFVLDAGGVSRLSGSA